jgi:hypothetical protein
MAMSHADHMIRDIFQPFSPGCVWHMIVYNYSDGGIISRSSTPQGLGNNTVWSRGQAWSTYGFAIAYRYTGLSRYLAAAQASAECFLRLLSVASDNMIPYWDFNATAPHNAIDTSAAAIFASGLIEIAWYTADPDTKTRYLSAAQRILASLTTTYLEPPARSPGFFANGTTTYPQYGIPIIYGDYYGLEALQKWDATSAGERASAVAAAVELQRSGRGLGSHRYRR